MMRTLSLVTLLSFPAMAQEAPPPEPGRGMALTVAGVSETPNALRVAGADGLDMRDGALRVTAGRLILGEEGARVTRLRGQLSTAGGTRVNTQGTQLLVGGGNLEFGDSTTINMSESSLSVTGGSMNLRGGSTLRIDEGSSVSLADKASASLTDASTLTIFGGGNLEISRNASFISQGSSITVNGGSLNTTDSATFNMEQSQLTVRDGNVNLSGSANVSMARSELTVRGGTLKLSGKAKLLFQDGVLEVRSARLETNFALLLTGTSEARYRDCELVVGEGGSIRIDEETSLEFRRSTLTVPDGQFAIEDLARLDAACQGDVVLRVRQGKTEAVCLRVGERDDPRCVGFLDEDASPPEWKCEDPCLESDDGLLCGNSDHL